MPKRNILLLAVHKNVCLQQLLLAILISLSCFTSSCQQSPPPNQNTDRIKEASVPSYKVDTVMLEVWKKFIDIVEKRETQRFFSVSRDSIDACGATIKTTDFVKHCWSKIFTDTVIARGETFSKLIFLDREVISSMFPNKLLNELKKKDSNFIIKEVAIQMPVQYHEEPWSIVFEFVETHAGFKLYGCNVFGAAVCCRYKKMQVSNKKQIVIDGNRFSSLAGFYKEIDGIYKRNMTMDSVHNYDDFDALLFYGGSSFYFAEPVKITWKQFRKSQNDLGKSTTAKLVSIIEAHNHIDFSKKD